MSIWIVENDLSYDFFRLTKVNTNPDAMPVFFKGQRMTDSWVAPSVDYKGHETATIVPDFPFFSHGALVCRESFWPLIKPVVENDVETLSVHSLSGIDFIAMNILTVIECLDMKKSEYDISRPSGAVNYIRKYVVDTSAIPDTVCLFKMPQLTATKQFCTSVFKNWIESNNCTGLQFRQISP